MQRNQQYVLNRFNNANEESFNKSLGNFFGLFYFAYLTTKYHQAHFKYLVVILIQLYFIYLACALFFILNLLAMDFKDIISTTLILFSVIDIIGNIPIIIDLKNRGVKIEPGKASLAALVIMSIFLISGESILSLFGVDVASFAVAGSIILFLLGMEMILGITLFRDDPKSNSGTIVPIAFPLIAGAGTMTTIISLQSKYSYIDIQVSIIINIILVFIVLRTSGWIRSKIGPGGANVLRKLFGIILLAIAIKLFRDNFHLIITQENVIKF